MNAIMRIFGVETTSSLSSAVHSQLDNVGPESQQHFYLSATRVIHLTEEGEGGENKKQ